MVVTHYVMLISGEPCSHCVICTFIIVPTCTNVILAESEDCPAVPHFDSRSRIFELDSCGGNGKVCLVYRNCSQGFIFFMYNCL